MLVYFYEPENPWQRGTNESANGLLRQCFPKHTGFSAYSPAHLEAVAHELNTRPGKEPRLGLPQTAYKGLCMVDI